MNKRLLIIDSEPFYRDIMNRIFGSTYSVGFAKNIDEAGEVMKIFEPGVVFFELRQADVNQLALVFDSLKGLRPDTPLIVAVSENNRELERYARENNIFYYMLRPFNLKELWDAIECGFVTYEKNINTNWYKKPSKPTAILEGLA
jgi:DNA-binding NtrC family response regulator